MSFRFNINSKIPLLLLLGISFLSGGDLLAGVNKGKKIRLNLETAVRIGTTNHFALRAVKNRRVAIRELITERWRVFLPRVGVSYNRTRDIVQGGDDSFNHDIRLSVEQVIYDGGTSSLNLDVAKLDALLTHVDSKIIANRLRLEIQRAYLRVLSASGKVLLNQKSLKRALVQLKHARLEEKVGLATKVQVLTVASRVREIELALLRAGNEYRQAIHDLKLILNLDYEVDVEVEGDIFRDFILQPPVTDVGALIQEARHLRPEVRRSNGSIHRLNKERKIAENSWIPRLSVSGFVGRTGRYLPARRKSWGINFNLTFPIGSTTATSTAGTGIQRGRRAESNSTTSTGLQFFDDLSYGRRVLESKIALGEAIASHREMHNRIAIEVERTYDSLREAWESIRIGNGRVFFRYESLRIINTRAKVGDLKRSDILLAETELVTAQEDLTDSIARYMSMAYQLEFTSGRDPGSLRFFHYSRGQGNTLLSRLLKKEATGKEKPGEKKETLKRKPREGKSETKKNKPTKKFLLDDVKVE